MLPTARPSRLGPAQHPDDQKSVIPIPLLTTQEIGKKFALPMRGPSLSSSFSLGNGTGTLLPQLLDSRQRLGIGRIRYQSGLVLAQGLGLTARGSASIPQSEVGVAIRLIQAKSGSKVALCLPQRAPAKIQLAEKVVGKDIRVTADGSAEQIFGLAFAPLIQEKRAEFIENAVVEG